MARFERDFADYKGVAADRVVAVNSCTAALHLAYLAAGVGPGDEVITTPLSWVATSNVILAVGARPVFIDIDPFTRNLNPDRIEEAITPATRAIMPVDLAGLPPIYLALDKGDYTLAGRLIYGQFIAPPTSFSGMPEAMDLASGISPARMARLEKEFPTSLLGDTLNFLTTVSDYPPADGWTFKIRLIPRFTSPVQSPITIINLQSRKSQLPD